jgi:hypothetical protein
VLNQLLFDFENFALEITPKPDSKCNDDCPDYYSYSRRQRSNPQCTEYLADITPLVRGAGGFNHASCQCYYPDFKIDAFKILEYSEMKHLHLRVFEIDSDGAVHVESIYNGVSCL